MRQKLRKLLRQVEADPSLSITQPTAATISADIEAMNALWLARWAERKGTERAHRILATNRQLLLDAFGRGDLFMPVLRKDGIMVAALATLVDPLKKAALFYMTGRDESFEGPAPGLLLHAHSIRSLIGEGFRTYDFLRGDEPYKLLFGPRMQHLQCLRIATRSGLNLGDRLESRAIRSALTLATVAHRKGRFRQAAAGYTQILATNPNDADALYRYAQLLDKVGQADHARLLLRRAAYARTRTRADG
nr:GNAT family N-acetyltransferase [Devosia oryzisoli]